MKDKVISLVGILCIASLFVSGANAKGKPDGPGGPRAEQIVFTGDLIGDQIVENCCPNAGPHPEYTITLGGDTWPAGISGTYAGQLHLNSIGHPPGRRPKYKVQFWRDSPAPLAIQIIGGAAVRDRKNKSLTVTFTNEDCVDMYTGAFIAVVNFELKRTR
jgi:hypothetical protein